MDKEREYLFKVVISGDIADEAIGNIFSDRFFVSAERKSPIVVYMEMTQTDANQLNDRYTDFFEVTRAPIDWHI